jgi:putative peptide zinc metalloprotease protein
MTEDKKEDSSTLGDGHANDDDVGKQLVAIPTIDPDSGTPSEKTTQPIEEVVKERAPRPQEADGASEQPRSSPPGDAPSDEARPRVADGIELLGEYEDSGYKKPTYIARRADGQIILLTQLLHLIAEECDGNGSYSDIAERVSDRFGKTVSVDNVRQLADERLRPLGVLTGPDGASPEVEKADPLLALKFRTKVIPAGLVRAITVLFRPLFWPPVIVAVVGAIIALDVWLFFIHGVAQPARQLLYQPALLLMVVGLVVVSVFFHECGHATALAYGGGKPGVMGAGIYVVWPAFYTDVTDAYRLGRGGRIRTDLGGVYFNGIFALITAGVYFLTRFEPLLIIVLLQHFAVLQQMLPLLRLDGDYVLSDLTGVPDLFARIRPTLRSLIPWRKTGSSVKELKPWVRFAVTAWVLAIVPLLLYVFTMLVISAPRIFATAWDSMLIQYDRMRAAFGGGEETRGLASSFQMMALGLPIAGMTLTTGRVAKRVAHGAWRTSEDRPFLRALYGVLGLALIVGVAFLWMPNGEYKPIQPDEAGTLPELTRSITELRGGRPGLTDKREAELGGAPALREQVDSSSDPFDSPADPAGNQGEVGEQQQQPAETGETPSPGDTAPGEGSTPEPSPTET